MRIQFIILLMLLLGTITIIECDDSQDSPYNTISELPKLGMIISPPFANDEESYGLYYPDYIQKAKSAGVELAYYYLEWQNIEPQLGNYDFTGPDEIYSAMDEQDVGIAFVIDLIDVFTGQRNQYPQGLETNLDFDDPLFVQAFGNFVDALVNRYQNRLQYLYLSNEIDVYLRKDNLDELSSYCTMLDQIIERLNTNYPQVKVGTVSTFHDNINNDTLSIPEELARHVNVLGYSLYILDTGTSRFQGPPSNVRNWLPIMQSTTGSTPIAIVETSWTAQEDYGGGEQVQADYVYEIFRFKDFFQDQLEYICWFTEHDLRYQRWADVGFYLFFETGLISYEGVERLAWKRWIELYNRYQ